MKTYYYVHTGHRIGLDRFRRAIAILHTLEDLDITLLTSDYRIAHAARDFGVEKSVGIDVVRNIPHIAQNGDKLIFDSQEANPLMLEDMRNYFSQFIRISDIPNDTCASNEHLISPYLSGENICQCIAVDKKYFDNTQEKTVPISYFFGDDDYEKDLAKHFNFIKEFDAKLQLGFYYFLDYEKELKEKFSDFFEFEEYDSMIFQTKILVTASPQAVFDSLASGGKPIYFQREDYTQDFLPLFRSLNIPSITNYDYSKLKETIKNINTNKYKKLEQNSYKISKYIKDSLNL